MRARLIHFKRLASSFFALYCAFLCLLASSSASLSRADALAFCGGTSLSLGPNQTNRSPSLTTASRRRATTICRRTSPSFRAADRRRPSATHHPAGWSGRGQIGDKRRPSMRAWWAADQRSVSRGGGLPNGSCRSCAGRRDANEVRGRLIGCAQWARP